MKKYICFLSISVCSLFFISCETDASKDTVKIETDEGDKTPGEVLDEALADTKKAIDEAKSESNKNKAVNFREFKDEFPSSIGNLEMIDSEGETTDVFGFKISNYEASYSDGDGTIKISIADLGGISSVVNSLAPWAKIEIDKESSEGYERTTTIEGHKALEEYDENRKEGKIAIFINNRLVLNIEGENVSENQLKKALRKIDIGDLEDLIEE
jgi:hypothetical protein